jgi:hypothetical protein
MANNIERHFIENMGLTWNTYQKAVYGVKVKIKSTKKSASTKQRKASKVR